MLSCYVKGVVYCPLVGVKKQTIHQGGVTPPDSIVTAATVLVNPSTKEGVELPHILPFTSVNVRVVNGQWLKSKAVNSQSPKNQCGQQSKCQKEVVKVLTCSRSRDYRVYGSDTPLIYST